MIGYTIGYEGLNLHDFVQLLKGGGIETLIDIRELPISRKPGFSKTALSNELKIVGINYIHQSLLGCPRDIRHDYKKDNNWIKYSIRFLDYLCDQDDVINWLIDQLNASICCLMCFEQDFTHCHRSHVVNVVQNKLALPSKFIELRDSERVEVEIPLLVDRKFQLASIDQGIDVEFLKENINLCS